MHLGAAAGLATLCGMNTPETVAKPKIKQPPVLFAKTQAVIAQAAALLGGPMITYWNNPRGSVCANDVVALCEVLERLGWHDTIYLFIKSDGGSGHREGGGQCQQQTGEHGHFAPRQQLVEDEPIGGVPADEQDFAGGRAGHEKTRRAGAFQKLRRGGLGSGCGAGGVPERADCLMVQRLGNQLADRVARLIVKV